MDENVIRPSKGLHQDNSPQDQPKDTYRFALNSVNETELGDFAFLGNEEGNEPCDALPNNFIPIGKVYIGEGQTVIFSVSKDETISEIGILNDGCVYTTHVNDELSELEDKLNFKVTHQIDARYKLRRGCERTIYFTDDYNKPRYYNFDKPEDFQTGGLWIGTKFNLFKQYNSIPTFSNLEVLNSGGVLKPGSYNVAIQYVDEGLNPTEWMNVSDILNVYNDRTSEAFLDIQGSINNEGTDYENFPNTTKAIKVDLSDLDTTFAFYRLAFIEATNGSGFISAVKKTEIIPTSKNFFIYTGENIVENGTEQEIAFFNDTIYRAKSIEQIENRLILANTQGKQVDYCKLQKYASRIKADCITKKVLLNDITDLANPKNPIVRTQATGYMPGELYSFGIVYIFSDGSLSPVFHIPGKNESAEGVVYSTGDNVFPMSTNNTSQSNRYIDNESCVNTNYWGLDAEGDTLKDQLVRHHRFPKRSEINKSLVVTEASSASEFTYYRLQINFSGTIDISDSATPFGVNVYYTVDGQQEAFTFIINPADYASNPISDFVLSVYYTSNAITVTKIEEEQASSVLDVTSPPYVYPTPRGLSYSTEIISSTVELQNDLYSTEILGIRFSGVDTPSLADTNNEQVIGYYIVRNERTENEKTILDSAVLTPTVINNKYVSHGLLTPETGPSRISKNLYGLIHPEHKFNNIQYDDFDEIEQEGNFNILTKKYSKIRFNDVMDGTSLDTDKQKEGNDDGENPDGWGLAVIIRDAIVRFAKRKTFSILREKIKQVFYLRALESRDVNEGANTAYNIAADNRVGMIQMNEDSLIDTISNNLPYVLLKRNITDSYANFRLLPYYKDTDNPQYNNSTDVFGGDTYVSPMRYVNTMFWDNRPAIRAGKTSALNYIIGAVLIVVGTVLLIFSGGSSSALIIAGAGIAVAGAGAVFVASGIRQDAWNKAYNEEWHKGLRETTLDDWVNRYYLQNLSDFGTVGDPNTQDGPSDDEIQWVGDCVTDLWFESKINIQLRNKMTSDVPCFLDAPGTKESGNTTPLIGWEYFDIHYEDAVSRYPVSKLDQHIAKKLLVYNSKRKDNREYIGIPMGEYYKVNPDYNRINSQKVYFHLPLEYDCCSDCKEDFPHRVHYSEQSFQEELTDNYRVFLPNNYKDIDGETGEITNTFKIGNNLFLHTREALWQMPRSYQERVTDQIVSFIGTGSFFEIPPQKILDDDNGSSAGLQHQWSTLKTPYGYLFVSENQRKVYLFNGKELKTLSNIGLSNYFKENTKLKINEQYYNSLGVNYKYDDNPSNPFGSGFISTYDTKKERLIITKKDFKLSDEVLNNTDFEICIKNGEMILFQDFQATIAAQSALGWNYVGLEDCKMKFEKITTTTVEETRTIFTSLNNNADIIVWLDTSGSFNESARNQIKDAINEWLDDFSIQNPDWTGSLHFVEVSDLFGIQTERWIDALYYVRNNLYGGSLVGRDIIMVTFVNESSSIYHNDWSGSSLPAPNGGYSSDFSTFQIVQPECNSFIGLAYPLVFPGTSTTKEYLKHVLAALKGDSYTLADFNNLDVNPFMSSGEWNDLKTALMSSNPYPDPGLNTYGWNVISNRGWSGSGDVITAEQFQEDMTTFLEGSISSEEITVLITQQTVEYQFIEGTVVEEPLELNAAWTISFSLKLDTWTSWHSYLPEFYINTPEKFYSWKYGSNNFWKHNTKGLYQTYYGEYNPHVIEYVSLSNPLVTRFWNHIRLNTEAKIFDITTDQYNEERFITHNKLIVFNSRQCSGILELLVKDTQPNSEDYFSQQIINRNDNSIIIDRTERDWFINDLRDIRIDYTKPIWNSNIVSLQSEYFIDKILNTITLDPQKDWTQLESFKDKYLVVRLIFDNFANVKLITNYSVENEQQSFN